MCCCFFFVGLLGTLHRRFAFAHSALDRYQHPTLVAQDPHSSRLQAVHQCTALGTCLASRFLKDRVLSKARFASLKVARDMYLDGTRPGACDMTNIEGRQHSRGAVNLGLSENGAILHFIHWSIIIFPVELTF